VTVRRSKVNRSTPENLQDGPAPFRVELGMRIRWLLDQFATRVDAAEIAGVTPEHLASYISGRAKPPFELIARLAAAKDVSLDWIATGDGEPARTDAGPEGFAAIAIAGDTDLRYGAGNEPGATLLFSRAWLSATVQAPEEALRIVIQRGTANAPAIRDGDALLVDTTAERIDQDALYVFVRDGQHLARFVETFVDRRVALKARNPDYGTQILSPEEAARLLVFGRVRWRGGPI
jgi:Peptidase S24-like/Helix-turn-helix